MFHFDVYCPDALMFPRRDTLMLRCRDVAALFFF